MQAIIFDLDNTLYPPERELFSLIDKRINCYMSEVVGSRPPMWMVCGEATGPITGSLLAA